MKRKTQAQQQEGAQLQKPILKRSRSGISTRTSPDQSSLGDVGSGVRRRASQRGKSATQEEPEYDSLSSQAGEVFEDDETPGSAKSVPKSTSHTTERGTPRGLRNGTAHEHMKNATPTKGLVIKRLFSTPVKGHGILETNETPRIQRNADRSARRKSTRNLIERTILGNTSDNDEDEDNIARHIYDSGEDDELGQGLDEQPLEEVSTPSKRGRTKAPRERKRSPTPPEELESHEKYFFQNRGGRAKTSNNELSSVALLDHEEYFTRSRKIVDPHMEDIKFLEQLHAQSFNQWQFELSQDFNICVFGYGSKRALLTQFADHVYQSHAYHGKIVVINGYVNNLTIRDVLNTVASALAEHGHKLGSQPTDMLENLVALLDADKSQHITLLIHSIDRMPLRRLATQTILSRLSAHPQVHLVASADHPSFPLLWDSSLRSTFNFAFHDCTTFKPYSVEVDVVDEVHDLLGRSGRRVGGKEGVSFVLKSLPENAKNLFKVLIGEQLTAMENNTAGPENDEFEEDNEQRTLSTRKSDLGVEYRVLYQKAVEEFICSNEMNFRTLLKEFHDHQMIQSTKDALGTEILSVPFRKEELETILEDIVS